VSFRQSVLKELHKNEADQLLSLKKNIIRRLNDEHKKKYQAFINDLREIENIFKDDSILKKNSLDLLFTDENLTQLSHLAWIYINNLHSRQRLLNLVEKESKTLKSPLNSSPDALKNPDTLKRHENLGYAKNNLSEIDSEISRLEQKIELIKSNQVLEGSLELFWHEIDDLSNRADKAAELIDNIENESKPFQKPGPRAKAFKHGYKSGDSSPFSSICRTLENRQTCKDYRPELQTPDPGLPDTSQQADKSQQTGQSLQTDESEQTAKSEQTIESEQTI
jgi:hypothetical protein